jgi:glutamate racemase
VAQLSTRAEVVGQPAPLLVPLAEEGWTEGDVPRLVVRRYVEPLAAAGVDVVVLGCTHYPLLRAVIEDEVRARIGAEVAVVDSAHATAEDVRSFLQARGLARREGPGSVELLVTDIPRTFREVAARFLGDEVGHVEQVDL